MSNQLWRKLFWAGLLLFFVQSGFSQNQKLDEDNGVLGFSLGAKSTDIQGIKSSGKSQGLKRAVPIQDSLKLNGITLKAVRLYFYQGNLHSIEIKTSGANTEPLVKWLEERYGPGTRRDSFGASRYWMGEKVALNMEQNLVSKDATFNFISREVNKAYYNATMGMTP